MNLNQRMIEYIKEIAEVIHTTDGKLIGASQMLERFLFPPAFTWYTSWQIIWR